MGIYALFWSASLLSGLSIRSRMATNLFLFVMFVFIGLRLDTGFDWPVYKQIFQDFQLDFSLLRVALYSQIYGQEPGFLLLLGLSSQYFENFEVFQALVTLGLLWSTALLARTVGVRKVALAVAIAMTFLMWTLGFSTLRQTMAISLFNFGLVCYFRKRNALGTLLFVLSTMFQISSIVYIAAFFACRYVWKSKKPPTFSAFWIGTISAATIAPLGIFLVSIVSSQAADKLDLYQDLSGSYQFGLLELIFLFSFVVSALLVSRSMVKPGPDTPHANDMRRLILVLSAIGASSGLFLVLRDRVASEQFLLVSIYLMMPGVRYRWQYVGFFVSFGIFTTAFSIFTFPARLAFTPYQNVIVNYVLDRESTGPYRSSSFFQIYTELNALAR